MPALKTLLRKIDDLNPVSNPVPPTPSFPPTDLQPVFRPTIRCPIPPLNIDPDSLRQYYRGGRVPQIRLIPLPPNQGGGQGSTVVNQTIVNKSGGGGGGTVTATLVKTNLPFVTSPISAGGVYQVALDVAKAFQLLNISVDTQCEIRLYGSATAQGLDVTRGQDQPVPPEVFDDIVTDVLFDTVPYYWDWQNRVGTNADHPQQSKLYMSVFDTQGGSGVITGAIQFVSFVA